MYFQPELKESGHTPELITEHHGREVLSKIQNHSEESDGPNVSQSRYVEWKLSLKGRQEKG